MTVTNQNVTPDGAGSDENISDVKAPLVLKIIVAVLGIAIIGMLGLILMKIISGDHKKTTAKQMVGHAVSKQQNMLIEDREIKVPAGTVFEAVTSDNAHLILHFKGADKTVLVLLDKQTGDLTNITVTK
ncbi:hypothetical protein [Kordiimonas pumila]|uniref:PepSY domain-containing protein n=1 Tax=Kordiimonas pumila TaxID=2161677 RepID=A0ABV7D798_9PROT|nr:hypothetical protein [Kordiimonas pumila]